MASKLTYAKKLFGSLKYVLIGLNVIIVICVLYFVCTKEDFAGHDLGLSPNLPEAVVILSGLLLLVGCGLGAYGAFKANIIMVLVDGGIYSVVLLFYIIWCGAQKSSVTGTGGGAIAFSIVYVVVVFGYAY